MPTSSITKDFEVKDYDAYLRLLGEIDKRSITSYSRGWEIYYDGKDWRYSDNNQIHDDSRPCKRCGRMPTADGHDACLGYIDDAIAACCGHGVADFYVITNQND
jgi:hypothetical protein